MLAVTPASTVAAQWLLLPDGADEFDGYADGSGYGYGYGDDCGDDCGIGIGAAEN